MREPASKADSAGNKLEPLPGEPGIPSVAQPARISVSKKGLLAVALLVLSLVVVCAISIQRLMASGKKPEDAVSKRAGDRPAAATTEPRRFDLSVPAVDKAASAARPAGRIPAIVPSDDELAEPIGVRRTGPSAPPAGGPKPIAPEDAPAVLVSSRPTGTAGPIAAGRGASPTPTGSAGVDAATSTDPLDETRRNLEAYERQLQGLLDGLTAKSNAASAPFSAVASPGGNALGGRCIYLADQPE